MTSAPGHERPAAGAVTVLNVCEVPAGQVGEFTARWRARAENMAAAPGFPDTRAAPGRLRAGALAAAESRALGQAGRPAGRPAQRRVPGPHPRTARRPSAAVLRLPAMYEIAAILTA